MVIDPSYWCGESLLFAGGYGNHGGAHIKDVGLVGAAIGVASFGMFKLLRERRRYGRG
jgi:hypothetical protein